MEKEVKLKLKQAYNAFTLVELSMYMALLAILVTVLFGFVNRTQRNLIEAAKSCEQFVRLSTALDLLKRDLASASDSVSDWDVQNFVFKKQMLNLKNEARYGLKNMVINKAVGWQVLKRGLCRIEGDYDFVAKKWGRRVVSFVGREIEELNVNLVFTECGRFVNSVVVNYRSPKVGNILTGKRRSELGQETIRLQNKFFLS